MRLWLNRTGEVSLREQLITQVVLAILCKELLPGQRLPSTRDLARRFGIHANTASAAYRELEREGWLEFRHGSGVFVRATRPSAPLSPELAVDQLIGELAAKARKMGASESPAASPAAPLAREPAAVALAGDRARPRTAPHRHPRDGAGAGVCPSQAALPSECAEPGKLDGSMPVVLPSKAGGRPQAAARRQRTDRAPGAPVSPSSSRPTSSATCPNTPEI